MTAPDAPSLRDDRPGAPALLSLRLPVLGIPTAFFTNAPEVRDLVLETYGAWADLDAPASDAEEADGPGDARADATGREPAGDRGGGPSVKILLREPPLRPEDVGLGEWADGADGGAAGGGGTGPVLRAPDRTRLYVLGEDAVGLADATRGNAVAHVTRDLLERRAAFVDGVMAPLTLFLLDSLDREPVHAAAVARGGVALLLAAPSGTGKSTLAYTAWRHGFSVLADEPVHVQIAPRLRVWGRSGRLHLPPDVRDRVPQLRSAEPRTLFSGKRKIVVETGKGTRWADRAGLVLLEREGAAVPSLEPIPPDEAVAELTATLDPGYDLFGDTIALRIRRVAEGGAWRLTLSDDPEEAVALLDAAVATLRPSSG